MRALKAGAVIAAALALTACEKAKAPPEGPAAPLAKVLNASPKPFDVTLVPKGSYAANQPGVAEVQFAARAGFHVNSEYPAKFTFAKDSSVTFAAESVALLDVMESTPCADHAEDVCAAKAPIAFTVGAAGTVKVAGVVALSVCNAKQCLIEKVPVELVVVAAPAP